MKILAVSYDVPHPDQSSGELRFCTLLSLLARDHEVSFYSNDQQSIPERDHDLASGNLRKLGIRVERGTFEHLLRRAGFDIVIFEFYHVAERFLDAVRTWQPGARVIVDSVDVHFHRLRSKARLTGLPSDHNHAETVRDHEMSVYDKADLVLTVSEEDSHILRKEGLQSDIDVIPNIHDMHPLISHQWSDRLELIFIGSYKWAPNVDAMAYFCQEVLPLVRKRIPSLRLRIVGNAPTEEVKALASEEVDVVGFVPETTTYLLSSDISIAPLRFGGGIKGKIGEAMAHGLPVVTTTIGAEGFGFEVGKDVLVEDTPQAFADAIEALWQDRDLYEHVRKNGWNYINDRYSVQAVDRLITPLFERLSARRTKRLSPIRRLKNLAPHYLEKYVCWRFRG
ncbi:MAG: glycosyltransferase family 4 protein [Thiobacillus sp.]|nr:glycosyltransferase family 4 protein [Thiobacillus sp.]